MITLVSGIPRCGSTLMMRMLHAGGMPVYAANHTSYETELTLGLPRDFTWLRHCEGRALKLLDPQRFPPPKHPRFRYATILMERNPHEQARSIIKFMALLKGMTIHPSQAQVLVDSIFSDREKCRAVLRALGPVKIIRFENAVTRPGEVAVEVANWLEKRGAPRLSVLRMAASVVQRTPKCLPGLLELGLMPDDDSDRGEAPV